MLYIYDHQFEISQTINLTNVTVSQNYRIE